MKVIIKTVQQHLGKVHRHEDLNQIKGKNGRIISGQAAHLALERKDTQTDLTYQRQHTVNK